MDNFQLVIFEEQIKGPSIHCCLSSSSKHCIYQVVLKTVKLQQVLANNNFIDRPYQHPMQVVFKL